MRLILIIHKIMKWKNSKDTYKCKMHNKFLKNELKSIESTSSPKNSYHHLLSLSDNRVIRNYQSLMKQSKSSQINHKKDPLRNYKYKNRFGNSPIKELVLK